MASVAAPRSARRRSAGEGTVFPRTDGKNGWRGQVSWTDEAGMAHRRTVSAPTSAEARAKLDRLREELRLGTLAPAGAGTVAEYLAGWIERYRARVRPATWRGAETHVRCYLIPALGTRPLAKLTAADVERAMAAFVRDGRPATTSRRGRQKRVPVAALTARHVRATLRRALADAVRAGLVGRNVAADAAPPYVAHRPVAYLAAPELRHLLDATRDDEYGPLYALAATTGLRQGELLGLAWADLDLGAGTLTVRHAMALARSGGYELAQPKTARSRRTIPLPGTAREALARQLERQEAARALAGAAWQDRAGLVFTDAIGRPLRPEAVSLAFRRARAAAGVPPVRFHDLRHSAATLMLAEGVPLAVISEWLGHAGIAITASHYAAVVPALRHEAAAAVDRALR